MSSLIGNLILGITLAAPIGPVGTEVIQRGLKQGFWPAYIIAIGSIFGDGLCLLISYLGLAQILQTPLAKIIVWFIGSTMLLYLGAINLKNAFYTNSSLKMKNQRSGSSLILGVLLAIANPLSMVFWFGIFGAIIGDDIQAHGYSLMDFLPHTVILLGVLLWFTFLCTILHISKRLLNDKLDKYSSIFFKTISGFAGAVLLTFGVNFASKTFYSILNYIH